MEKQNLFSVSSKSLPYVPRYWCHLYAFADQLMQVVGFILLGIIIAAGGVPGSPQGYLGAHYWYDPGAFNHGFKGLCSVFVTAAFVSLATYLSHASY
jgi:hypothetical protein